MRKQGAFLSRVAISSTLVMSVFLSTQVQASPLVCHRLFLGEQAPSTDIYRGADAFNRDYFSALLRKNEAGTMSEDIVLYDSSKASQEGRVVYPTAVAPESLMRSVPVVNYSSLRDSQSASTLLHQAKRAVVHIAKMQAGTGSSLTRTSFVARVKSVLASVVRLGAKGIDLIVPQISTAQHPVSIAEAQVLQASTPEVQASFKSIHWVDLVSPETSSSIESIWQTPRPGIVREEPVYQYNMPTVTVDGKLSDNRVAPAGHGLFGFYAVKKALSETQASSKGKILVLANGEDLSGGADPYIVGHMLEKRIPILMITTDKTEIDLKGGQIAVSFEGKVPVVSIVEQAQAEVSGQKKYFEEIGLRSGDRQAMFNTNMVLINYEELTPIIQALYAKVGEAKFNEIIGPNLIKNWKAQIDKDGVERKYLQLEGAMGSVILNLDKYFRLHEARSILSFVNIDRAHRTSFFAPIKTAFDYYMQFFSDRFSYEPKAHRLVDHRPGYPPSVKLVDIETKDKFYADVDNVLATFQGASILNVDQLSVEGRFALNGIQLAGQVSLVNKTGQLVSLEKYFEGHPGLAVKTTSGWLVKDTEILILEK